MFHAAVVLGLISLVVGAPASSEEDTDRIIGGRTALIQDCPCVVSLQLRGVHKCGGSIVDQRHILTAAHCLQTLEKYSLRDIGIRTSSTVWSTGGSYFGVKSMIKHPKYNPETKEFDFGMIKVDKIIEYDVTTKPCTLATKIPAHGRSSLICGWGLKKEDADMVPNMLQKANVTIISRKVCTTDFKYTEDEIKGNMMCASDPNIDACQGDSGGPIITGNVLTGVTSFGKGCGRKEYPGVYATVASVLKWIANKIETM